MIACCNSRSPDIESLQVAFLSHLPQIQLHADFAFRHIRCPHTRADYTAETVALAWKVFVALARRGKDVAAFITTFALRCSQAVKAGRRLCGQESRRDVLAPTTQQVHGLALEHLLPAGTLGGNPWEEALRDNSVSPVLDQVGWKLDFPRWRGSHSPRDQAILDDLMIGECTQEVAQHHALSPARVSQLRREFHQSWRRFHGEIG